MAIIRLSGFAGENRALHPKLLPEVVGVTSRNQKPGRGDLRPWRAPLAVATVPSGRNTIYRAGRDVASDSQYWLSWTGTVHAARGFSTDDTSERTYFTGDGQPKWTDNTLWGTGTTLPVSSRPWGVPAPTEKLTCAAAVGAFTGDMDTAYYVYTYVNSRGEESANSPISTINTRPTDAPAVLTIPTSVPAGLYDIMIKRVYRTQAGSGATAEFYYLGEVAVGTSVFNEPAQPQLGEVLPSATWLPPPADLSFLTPLWNGMFAGISDNSVRFSEAYKSYAWPSAYDVIPPDGTPVGLGVFGQQLLVLTTGRPLLVAGSSPDSMDQMPLEVPQGCVASRSIVSMGSGVAWASNDGLCWYGAGGARLLTAGLMMRDDWQALVPSSIVGKMYEGLYFGSYNSGSGRQGFMINPDDPKGLYFLDAGYAAMHFDELQDQLYVLSDTSVHRWDAGAPMAYTFKSKLFQAPKPIQAFSCAQVYADAYPVTFRLYCDGALKHTQAVASSEAFRLPGGFYATTAQIELTGSNAIQGVVMAHSMQELATS